MSDADQKCREVDCLSCVNCRASTTDETLYYCAKCAEEESGFDSVHCQDCLKAAHKRSPHKATLENHMKEAEFEHSRMAIRKAKEEGHLLLYKSINFYLTKITKQCIELGYNVGHPLAVIGATGLKSFFMTVSNFGGHSLDLALPVSGGVTLAVGLLELGCIWYQCGIEALDFKEACKMSGLCIVRNGTMFGLMVGGTKAGAVAGTIVAPGIGTLIGAMIGSLLGGILGTALDYGAAWWYNKYIADNEVMKLYRYL